MDPDATLADIQITVIDVFQRWDDTKTPSTDLVRLYELAELINTLDVWLKAGGFLPAAWQKGRTPAKNRAALLRHQADDPHCTCNDCIEDYSRRLESFTKPRSTP